uniref:FAS1 domain-containing protein n=1 Tax=Knipowitschia caucasica TaxID=637954 RepID=A0AAV2JAZ6_KNICA
MATNGVVHVVKNVLYPADLPVGRQDLLLLLKKLIKYITIKFQAGFSYTEIPLTFIKRTITTTHYIETEPDMTKVIRVIEGEPSITKVTRVIEGEPSITKVTRVIEGEPSITKVTRVIEGEPSITTVTRVIEVEPTITRVGIQPRVIETEPMVTEVRVETDPIHVTRRIEGDPSFTTVTRVIGGDIQKTLTEEIEKFEKTLSEPSVTRVVVEGEPVVTKVTRVVAPSITKVTRVIEGVETQKNTGPDFSKITTIHGNPDLIEEESERITKIIKGGRYAAVKRAQMGARRRARARRNKPKA